MYQEMRSERLPYRTDVRWFHTETVTDGTGAPLIIPAVGRDAAVAVMPGVAASAQVEFTISRYDEVRLGNAIWHAWPAGAAEEASADVVSGAVTALRLVSTGESRWEVAL
ncbi:hypothetical protein [Halomonas citrativorans]|uniref:Uncharacterized protein n=1 Tax=Halomonas citrativorans TaxID=2742612 RepID=A0ABR9F9A3_9GAMM|nr:hypothetical protein [Halomonas citrativorans]MBE0403067.1 hypothetical protein [Halomonas citrativorans]